MPLNNAFTQSTADATVYYDFGDASDATIIRASDTTMGMEENEVEDILNDLATPSISNGNPTTINTIGNPPSPTDSRPETHMFQQSLPSSPLRARFSNLVLQAGTPPPVLHLFPELKRDDLIRIMSHQLEARDLHRLQPTIHSDGSPDVGENIENATFDSLYLLLLRYFEIVSMYFAQDYLITLAFFEFLAHFQSISSKYEWPAVRQYTLSFFDCRRVEMYDSNDYSGWLRPDEALSEKYLVGHEKGGALSLVSSTTISIPDTAPPQVVPQPTNVNNSDEASRKATLFIGFLCSFVGLILAAIVMIPFSLARLLFTSNKGAEKRLEETVKEEEESFDFYD
ncbi:hypothetical protein JR316_0007649 [Psilocybe cubensis]|uniref:Uncharacterized protein n=2 Tax=Psilocybe cubensis TaxID=181762 RepID=A0A8H7XSP7_PSICU|nr:hypothetical protein JR316_0007649 [Psilocybe cubensis]KAH9479072.1 hypothetical protein JR316_0007649 [Psilocybe cubensis]